MRKLILVALIFGSFFQAFGQKEAIFYVSVNTDSLLLGNYVAVTFKLENGKGQSFTAPNLEEFAVVSGPSTSSQYSMINGEVSQSISYTYQIKPAEVGSYYIQPASIEVAGEILETNPIEIIVYPNPDGIIQSPEMREDDFWDNSFRKRFSFPDRPSTEPTPLPEKKVKKKRKTVKI